MKGFVLLSVVLLCGCASTVVHDDWYSRYPMPAQMKSLVELPAADALKICQRDLLGKNRAVVRAYLGMSDLNHGDEEFIYHPIRADGSMWILIVEFDSEAAVEIFAQELASPTRENA
jgi:hypothetical protein